MINQPKHRILSVESDFVKKLIFGLSISLDYLKKEEDPERSVNFIYMRVISYLSSMTSIHIAFLFSLLVPFILKSVLHNFGLVVFASGVFFIIISFPVSRFWEHKLSRSYYSEVIIKVQKRLDAKTRRKLLKSVSFTNMLNALFVLAVELPISMYVYCLHN